MDSETFREFGKKIIDFIVDYVENIRERNVLPSVQPGYLIESLPKNAPENAENWNRIFEDIDRLIMPGITHWQSPHFHAYFPCSTSYAAILGDLLSSGIGCIGFNWLASPACTELEVQMMNWLAKLFNLPEEFLNNSQSNGGGVIQGSASESTFFSLLIAKEKAIKKHSQNEQNIKQKLVAYTSVESNSSVEKAALLGSVIIRFLPTDSDMSLRAEVLENAIKQDRNMGLIPFYVVCTLGTTNSCAFDDLQGLGNVCVREDLWLHVDAAYAGAALICPEYQYLIKGIELVTSITINLHKWMLVNFDCSALWMKNANDSLNVFKVERIYLKHNSEGAKIPEYRHWQIAIGRRFRSLKVWMMLRSYGAEGIRKHIRNQVELAKQFEKLVRSDNRFEIVTKTSMGLVCFRLRSNENSLTEKLVDKLLQNRKVFVITGKIGELITIRFVICSRICKFSDVCKSWAEIQYQADRVFTEESVLGEIKT